VRSSSSGKRAARPSLNHDGTVIQGQDLHTEVTAKKVSAFLLVQMIEPIVGIRCFELGPLGVTHIKFVRSGDMRPQLLLLLLLHHTHTHDDDDDDDDDE